MMKIPLFTSLNQSEMNYLNNAVLLKNPRQMLNTTFILDTGSPTTILGYFDALRLQIPFKELPLGRIVRIGGRKFQGYSYDRLTFVFKSEDNKLISEQFSVCVVKPTSNKEAEDLYSLPTIIGTDFLKEKKYILFCDMSHDIAYIEKKD